ncbi:MAG: aldo/keto reductase, partial [Solirubrobacteraceae bacterium]
MEQRALERVGRSVGVIGLGAWQLGADWGEIGDEDAA